MSKVRDGLGVERHAEVSDVSFDDGADVGSLLVERSVHAATKLDP
jgi:hypothetical protein